MLGYEFQNPLCITKLGTIKIDEHRNLTIEHFHFRKHDWFSLEFMQRWCIGIYLLRMAFRMFFWPKNKMERGYLTFTRS